MHVTHTHRERERERDGGERERIKTTERITSVLEDVIAIET